MVPLEKAKRVLDEALATARDNLYRARFWCSASPGSLMANGETVEEAMRAYGHEVASLEIARSYLSDVKPSSSAD